MISTDLGPYPFCFTRGFRWFPVLSAAPDETRREICSSPHGDTFSWFLHAFQFLFDLFDGPSSSYALEFSGLWSSSPARTVFTLYGRSLNAFAWVCAVPLHGLLSSHEFFLFCPGAYLFERFPLSAPSFPFPSRYNKFLAAAQPFLHAGAPLISVAVDAIWSQTPDAVPRSFVHVFFSVPPFPFFLPSIPILRRVPFLFRGGYPDHPRCQR